MENRYILAFHEYLHAWLSRRSMPELMNLLSAGATGFGTGFDENAFGAAAIKPSPYTDADLYMRDLQDAPDPVRYVIKNLAVTEISENAAVVMAALDLSAMILEQWVQFHGLRISLVLADQGEGLKIRHDHLSFPTAVHGKGEAYPLKELEERINAFERVLKERTRTLREAYMELAIVVNTDKVTGIASRQKLDETLLSELQRYRRYDNVFTVLFFDVDRFKQINDTFGHIGGDRILKSVAETVSSVVRETDLVGRWGGDEFMAILPETTPAAGRELARKLQERIKDLFAEDGSAISISMGIAGAAPDDTPETLLARVDAAMYRAKASGGDCLSE